MPLFQRNPAMRSVVVPEHVEPLWQLWGKRLAAPVALVLGVVMGYVIGGELARQLQDENEQLLSAQSVLQQELLEVRQSLLNIQAGAEVDRYSVEESRLLIRDLQAEVADLSEEIAFYRGLMAPDEQERGVGVRSWNVTPLAESGAYRFQLTVHQLALKHQVLRGDASVEVVGRDAKGEARYSLAELQSDSSLKLRFKYFQTIEGSLQLPEGFVPEQVEVEIEATSPKKMRLKKVFDWMMTEG